MITDRCAGSARAGEARTKRGRSAFNTGRGTTRRGKFCDLCHSSWFWACAIHVPLLYLFFEHGVKRKTLHWLVVLATLTQFS